MSNLEFLFLCQKHLILPELALEDEALLDLLKNKESADIIENYLINEF
tara:strand:- start:52 stop:195 length:144 start_codon:yes stop_codon:yes gene_type:complete